MTAMGAKRPLPESATLKLVGRKSSHTAAECSSAKQGNYALGPAVVDSDLLRSSIFQHRVGTTEE